MDSIKEGVSTGVVAFLLAILVSLPTGGGLSSFPPVVAIPATLVVVGVGVLFDTIGLAAASAEEAGFHAMAAKKIPGARQSILVVKNAGRVITICNDIVGDLAGTLSGAMAAGTVFRLSAGGPVNQSLAGAIAIALVAGITVGAKAAAKRFAMENAVEITRFTGYVLYLWEQWTGLRVFRDGKGGGGVPPRRRR
ncbi:MAG: hypothetical protein ACM3X4_09260 [Ignavibacteriales bacterium]